MKLTVSDDGHWPVAVGWEDSDRAVAHFFGIAGERAAALQDAREYAQWRNRLIESSRNLREEKESLTPNKSV